MIYDILEQKIITAGLAVAGESLFRDFMPAECSQGVLIRSPLTGVPIDPHIEGWHKVNMQVIIRHPDPVAGVTLANDVIRCLVVEKPETYPASPERGPAHISMFYPRQLPIQFPLLEGNAIEWSINFFAAFGFKPSWK